MVVTAEDAVQRCWVLSVPVCHVTCGVGVCGVTVLCVLVLLVVVCNAWYLYINNK